KLAIVRARLGRPDHAAPAETALAYLLEEWGATDPDLIRLRTEYADALFASGAIEAAQPIYALVRAAHASVTAESAADPFRVDAAGRFLLTCRDVSQRSAETALAHAQRVNRDVPDDPHYLATLARALMATGSSAEAVVTQRRACELLPEASGWRLAFESDLRAYGDGRLDDGWGSGG
ncbi:MAG: hypothetical protein HKN62_17730, partial [Phycisphaerales bacterium]|nr:hypothetical protein [Phycisphaerales bacterium]